MDITTNIEGWQKKRREKQSLIVAYDKKLTMNKNLINSIKRATKTVNP
jgi:hypothetical protein